jgi:uncharacterized membrane protein YidH (DUF202 family)
MQSTELLDLTTDLIADALSLFGICLAIVGVLIATATTIQSSPKISAIDRIHYLRSTRKLLSHITWASIGLVILAAVSLAGHLLCSVPIAIVSLLLFGSILLYIILLLLRLRSLIEIVE